VSCAALIFYMDKIPLFFRWKCSVFEQKSQKRLNCGIIACFRRKSLLSLYTVLLYRLTGKLINFNRKPSKLQIVQWRATPSGSFREPVDYKGQEPSNLVFSEFRRSLLYSKTFLYADVCRYIKSVVANRQPHFLYILRTL
jgi:hypothetical protein